ncbi:hypothetical protein [Lysinibacillus xylanilyticus]|uniref:hypothetical protein n=1 Tax=Lysinibacillus xylanilyticus TaxID=582475 RepID=UPI003D092E6D
MDVVPFQWDQKNLLNEDKASADVAHCLSARQRQMFSVAKAKRQLQMFSVAKAKRQLQLRQGEIDF